MVTPLHAAALSAMLLAWQLPAHADAPALSIGICDDGNEWPPYSYHERRDGIITGTLSGYSVDVIGEILKRHSIAYSIDLIPWTRCQAVALIGDRYGMVLNMSSSRWRARHFYLSRPYYTATTHYYYSRRLHPDGLPIRSVRDLAKYRVCGVQGYNYEGLGLDVQHIDRGTRDFAALVSKVQLGRCTLFLEKVEIMRGFAAIGKDYLEGKELGHAVLPGVKPVPFHFGVSKRHPQALHIRAIIDGDLRKMEANGRLEELLKKANDTLAQD